MTTNKVVSFPTLLEGVEFHELQHNWVETDAYIKQLTEDKDKLEGTYKDCRDKLVLDFNEIRKVLDEREKMLLVQMDKQYTENVNILTTQLDLLKNHKNKNQETKCLNIIANVSNKGKTARESRLKSIHDCCESCIQESPMIEKVSIALPYTYRQDTKKRILDELDSLTDLKLKFDEKISKKRLLFTRLNTELWIILNVWVVKFWQRMFQLLSFWDYQ